jgi:ribosomal protein L24
MNKSIGVKCVLGDLVKVVGGRNKGKLGYVVGISVVECEGANILDQKITYTVDAYVDMRGFIKKKIKVVEDNLMDLGGSSI